LVASHNRLINLPVFTEQSRIKFLIVSHNKIKEIRADIALLYDLQNLSLDNNKISKLPESLFTLESLRELRIEHNQIE